MNTTLTTFHAADLAAWREWLTKNHGSSREIWLVTHKAHTGVTTLGYDESVEEALCWGWVDSLIRRLDDDRYARKFTPRRPESRWSKPNLRRLEKIVAEGRMTDAGRAVLPRKEDLERKTVPTKPPIAEMEIPGELRSALEAHDAARAAFEALAPSHRRQYLLWVGAAKRPETRTRRAAEALELLARGEKLGMK